MRERRPSYRPPLIALVVLELVLHLDRFGACGVASPADWHTPGEFPSSKCTLAIQNSRVRGTAGPVLAHHIVEMLHRLRAVASRQLELRQSHQALSDVARPGTR